MRRVAVSALVLAFGGPVPLLAQEEEVRGPRLSATVSQSFEVDSNLFLDVPSPGTSYLGDTRLAVGYLNETPTQFFALDFDTGLRALWAAEEDFDFTFASPSTAAAGYGQEWSSGAVEAGLSYSQEEVDFSRPLGDFFDPVTGEVIAPDDLSQREGDTIERRYDADFNLDLATDARSSYNVSLVGSYTDYDETGEDLTPRGSALGTGTWTLQLTPVLSSAVRAAYFYYSADNEGETEISIAEGDVGLVYEPSPVFSVTAGIGYADREEEQLVGGERETVQSDAGLTFVGSVRYDFEDVVLNANWRLTNAAPDTRFSGNLRAAYPLPRSVLFGRVFQQYAGGDTGDETRVTGAGIGILREITEVSRVNFDVAVARQVDVDTPRTEPDIERLDFVAVYEHDITEVVSGNLGYRYRYLDEEDVGIARSNAVFVELSRTFATRP
jgi:hypothetical protein